MKRKIASTSCSTKSRAAARDLLGRVDQPGIHHLHAQSKRAARAMIGLVAQETLLQTLELRPVRVQADAEKPDPAACSHVLPLYRHEYPWTASAVNGLFLRAGWRKPAKMDKTCPERRKMVEAMRWPTGDGSGRKSFFRYLTYSEEDEKWQLVCTDAGFMRRAPRTRVSAEQGRTPAGIQVRGRRPDPDRVPDHLHHQGPRASSSPTRRRTSWCPGPS